MEGKTMKGTREALADYLYGSPYTHRAGINVADAPKPERSMTEMEALNQQMADTARHLAALVDSIEGRVDGFLQASSAGEPVSPPTPQRPHGTLGGLRSAQQDIDAACQRLSGVAERLAGIL